MSAKIVCGKGGAKMKEATIKKKKLPQSRADKIINVVIYGIIILVLVAILYPLWLVVIASVSSSSAVMRGEVWIVPKEFSLTGYERIFSYTRLWNGYLNTRCRRLMHCRKRNFTAGNFLLVCSCSPCSLMEV